MDDFLYRPDLAWVHHVGHGDCAERAAAGLLAMLRSAKLPPAARVLDVGCGSGRLVRKLQEAGFDAVGVDASPTMLALARAHAPGARLEASSCRRGGPPGVPGGLPAADAVVSTGHVLNYLAGPGDIAAALGELAAAVRPGGLLAIDLMTERFARRHDGCSPHVRVEDDWVVVTRDPPDAWHRGGGAGELRRRAAARRPGDARRTTLKRLAGANERAEFDRATTCCAASHAFRVREVRPDVLRGRD